MKSNESIQVPETYTIDLGQSEDEILAGMRSKTRQYIRKAEREETEIERDVTGEYLHRLLLRSMRRRRGGPDSACTPVNIISDLFENYLADRQYLYVAMRHEKCSLSSGWSVPGASLWSSMEG